MAIALQSPSTYVLTASSAILDQVKDEWDFVIDPDVRLIVHITLQSDNPPPELQFNNVDLALQLLDDSSHGKDMDSFRTTEDMLGKALKGSVDSAFLPLIGSLLAVTMNRPLTTWRNSF